MKLPLFSFQIIAAIKTGDYIPLLTELKKLKAENATPDESIDSVGDFTGCYYCENKGQHEIWKDGKIIPFSWDVLIDSLCSKYSLFV